MEKNFLPTQLSLGTATGALWAHLRIRASVSLSEDSDVQVGFNLLQWKTEPWRSPAGSATIAVTNLPSYPASPQIPSSAHILHWLTHICFSLITETDFPLPSRTHSQISWALQFSPPPLSDKQNEIAVTATLGKAAAADMTGKLFYLTGTYTVRANSSWNYKFPCLPLHARTEDKI